MEEILHQLGCLKAVMGYNGINHLSTAAGFRNLPSVCWISQRYPSGLGDLTGKITGEIS